MALTNDFKVKNGLTVTDSISAGSCIEASCFIKNGGTSSQFLKADGSVDSSAYTTCCGNVTGSGVNNRLALWSGTSTVDSDSDFYVDGDTLYTCNLAAAGSINLGVGGNINKTSGDLTIDVAGDITLDADDDGTVKFKDGGTEFGRIYNAGSNLYIKSIVSNKDLVFLGNDNGSSVEALRLDMSDAGAADFGGDINLGTGKNIYMSGTSGLRFLHDGSNGNIITGTGDLNITNGASDKDIIFKGNDGGSSFTALTLDMSDAGTAVFNNKICIGNSKLVLNGTAVTSTAAELNLLACCSSIPGACCQGTTTPSNTQTFTNKSGNISQWTNDCGYITAASNGTVTSVTAGEGMTQTGVSTVNPTLNVIGATNGGICVTADAVCVDSTVVRTTGTQSIGGVKTFTDNVCVSDRIIHTGDSNTCIGFDADQLRLVAGSAEVLRVNTTGFIANEGGDDRDFRVESNNDANALFVDGSADKVGIGTANPSKKLHVAGDGLFTSGLTVQGDLTVTGDFTCLDTTISVTSALSVLNTGTGPALIVNQTGSNDIVDFRDDGTSAFYIEDGGNVGINDTNPGHKLDVNGNINVTGDYKMDDSTIINTSYQFTGNGIDMGDNHCIKLGAGDDLVIKHNGSNSYIENYTGDLNLANYADDKDIIFYSDNGSGGVTEYLTLDGGLGYTRSSQHLQMADGKALYLGNANDMGVYHNSTDSFLENSTGHICIVNHANDKDIVFKSDDGSGGTQIYMMLDGSEARLSTKVNNRFDDNAYLELGTSGDLQIYHSGASSNINNTTGHLYISNGANDSDIIFRSDDTTGGVTEYFRLDGGDARMYATREIRFCDGVASKYGNAGDLGIYHDGSNSYINDSGTGSLKICSSDLQIHASTTFNDHTRHLDQVKACFGLGGDLQIYHDGSNSYIQDAGTGDLKITTSAGAVRIDKGVSENMAAFIPDGAVELYYDNSKKFETTCSGISVCGNALVSGHVCATTKSFVVDNPTTGGQLRYSVVEGNEHGVTVRGSTCSGTIELPDEWDWLVDEDSVTAQLTPVGSLHQPYVVSQDNKQVVVCSDGCYNYNIYGTRKDVEPLEVNIS